MGHKRIRLNDAEESTQKTMTMSNRRDASPPPPSPVEARKALDEAFAEIGIFFKKKPIIIKLEQHLNRPIFVDEFHQKEPEIIASTSGRHEKPVVHSIETQEHFSLANEKNERSFSETESRSGTRARLPQKYWSADPRRGEGTKASDELAILSLSPKIGPAVRNDQLSKSTTKLPELSSKPFGPPSARKTPLGSCQLNKIRSQSQTITKDRVFDEKKDANLTYAEFTTSNPQSMRNDIGQNIRPHSVSKIEGVSMKREESRLSLAASHLPVTASRDGNHQVSPDLLRPLRFEQPGTVGREELIGREWLFDEVLSRLNSTRCVSIVGEAGSGKTTIIDELAQTSMGRRPHKTSVESPTRSTSSALLSKMSSSMSLHHLPSSRLPSNPNRQPSLDILAEAVVAYHFCQADNSATCLVPEFVRSIAAYMAGSRHLVHFQQMITQSTDLQELLSPQNCIKDSRNAFIKGVIEPMRQLVEMGKLQKNSQFIILLDSLDSAELHRPDYGPTIPNFLSDLMPIFPPQFKLVVTVRTSMRHLLDSFQTSTIRIDQFDDNKNIVSDTIMYTTSRLHKAPFIAAEVSINGVQDSLNAQKLLLQKLLNLSNGNFLYVKLVLDLIEARRLSLKSSSYSVLPTNLDELFSMLSNLQFQSAAAFERARPILSVCLASLYPLRDEQIYQAVSAGDVDSPLSIEEFRRRMNTVGSILTRRIDGRRVFLHPLYREWLCIPNQQNQRFVIDPRDGHALLALLLSRQSKPLHFSATIELGHHILKSHIFRGQRSQTGYSSSIQNTLWLMSANIDIKGGFLAPRNLFYPNLRVTKLLLLAGAPPNAKTSCLAGASPLGIASWSGCLQFCKLLLEHGADPNTVNDSGRTPISLAAEAGHVIVLELLYESGADILKMDNSGFAPVVHAAKSARTECVDFLLSREHPADTKKSLTTQVLVNSAAANNFQLVDIMLNYASYQPVLEFQCRINTTDSLLGESALTLAVQHGNVHMARHLIEQYSADINLQNEQKQTPVAVAAKYGHVQCVGYLLSLGARADLANQDGKTALMLAAQHGHAVSCQLLLDNGVNIEIVDSEGLTALSWAALKGHRQVAQVLLTAGSSIRHLDRAGRNLLHLAAISGDSSTVSLLLSRGCDQLKYDSANMRPLERAISARNADVALLLLRSGTKPEVASWALASDRSDLLFLLLHRTLEDGNKFYKNEQIEKASELYKLGLSRFQVQLLSSGLENAAELKASLLLGQSRCARRLGQQRQAEALASQALNLKPSWFHAYYARCRARVELGRLQEAYQDIVEASRLEPDNRVIKRYRIRLGEEGAKLGLKLSSQLVGQHKRYGSSDSLGGASMSSEITIREPPMPPPRSKSELTERSDPKSYVCATDFNGQPKPHSPIEAPRPRPRTNPFYSMSSYKHPTPIKVMKPEVQRTTTHDLTPSQVTNTFSYLSLNRDPELKGVKPKQTDL